MSFLFLSLKRCVIVSKNGVFLPELELVVSKEALYIGLNTVGNFVDLLPTSGNGTIRHLILPAFTVSLSYISTYIRLIRNNMLENMKQDYVLYANVRGLPQRSILVKHILKNSMHTCIVAIGMSIPQLISGTIVVENVFAWPGLGTLCISRHALPPRDSGSGGAVP